MQVVQKCAHCGAQRLVVNGAWLRERRIGFGLSLREVARRAGVSPAYVSDIERGRRNWSPRLALVYGMPKGYGA